MAGEKKFAVGIDYRVKPVITGPQSYSATSAHYGQIDSKGRHWLAKWTGEKFQRLVPLNENKWPNFVMELHAIDHQAQKMLTWPAAAAEGADRWVKLFDV